MGSGPGKPVLPCRETEPGPDYLMHRKMFHLEVLWMHGKAKAVLEKFGALVDKNAGSYFREPSEVNFTRSLDLPVETLAALEKLPELLEALRGVMACSAKEWRFLIRVELRITPLEMTAEQQKWLAEIEDKASQWNDDDDYERLAKTQEHLIETEFRLRMNEEEGEEPQPEDFIPPDAIRPTDYSPHVAGIEDDEEEFDDEEEEEDYALKPFDEQEMDDDDDDSDEVDNNVKVAPSRGPDPDFIDDPYKHPLADSYRFYAHLTWDTFYAEEHNAVTVMQCMRRVVDEDLRRDV